MSDGDDEGERKRGKLPPVVLPPKSGSMAAATAPVPTPDGFMSTAAKMSLADIALALRDEQLDAQVIHYKNELATNPELDAVTAQVIADLQNLQQMARQGGPASRPPLPMDKTQLEIELIQTLKEMLGRTFRPGKLATTMERKLGEVAKRFARLFFESELADKIRGSKDEHKTMRFAEQALYHALTYHKEEIFGRLDGYVYGSVKIQQRAKEHFSAWVKELRNDFLSRTTPELNMLVSFLNETLTRFLIEELPPMLGELAWEVVKEARLAEARSFGTGYKISARAFPAFRQAFERRFLQRLVPFTEDEMLRRVRDSMGQFRSETIRFVADPEIFSTLCEVICDAVYDMLYNDGFLDLPSDWRAKLTDTEGLAEGAT
jgi:hypothetical protein